MPHDFGKTNSWKTGRKPAEHILKPGSTDKTEAVNIREKCMCIQHTEAVLWGRVKDFNVINAGPHCNKDQIIIKMQSKSVCLAPNSKQGKKLQKCWKRYSLCSLLDRPGSGRRSD
ncbi:C-X-C motif chemokine 9-like [Clarias magur]|uniref:C-X-C motif chemokine 9-like n=1 Tax=Clarias magur TaxID=1594786 RepID=A0A8J4XHK7_CLAMG|nr:C-X-C motif chemokine 9-like [Clarias magur]